MTSSSDRGVDPRSIAVGDARVEPDPSAALVLARRLAAGRVVLVTGSLHLLGRLLP